MTDNSMVVCHANGVCSEDISEKQVEHDVV
jgi:hypothetical protein